MCGRFALDSGADELVRHFCLCRSFNIETRKSIAPTQQIVIVRDNTRLNGFILSRARWGLPPARTVANEGAYGIICARAETIAETPAFHTAFTFRRCLIPTTGFYEWNHEGNSRQSYCFRMKDKSLFAMAGIWESWRSPDGRDNVSCAIITTQANDMVAKIHDRMPVIIPRHGYGQWTGSLNNGYHFREYLLPYPSENMTCSSPHC